jgi:hypothetical protein
VATPGRSNNHPISLFLFLVQRAGNVNPASEWVANEAEAGTDAAKISFTKSQAGMAESNKMVLLGLLIAWTWINSPA